MNVIYQSNKSDLEKSVLAFRDFKTNWGNMASESQSYLLEQGYIGYSQRTVNSISRISAEPSTAKKITVPEFTDLGRQTYKQLTRHNNLPAPLKPIYRLFAGL